MEENKSNKAKRVRTPNFTVPEKKILEELVSKYHTVIEKKGLDSESKDQRKFAWIYLTEEFNIRTKGNMRSMNSLKVCWENMKRQIKEQIQMSEKGEKIDVGQSPPPLQPRPERISRLVIHPQDYDNKYAEDLKVKQRKSVQDPKGDLEDDPLDCDDEDLIILNDNPNTHVEKETRLELTPNIMKRSLSTFCKSEVARKDSERSDESAKFKMMKTDKPNQPESLSDKLLKAKIELIKTMSNNAKLNLKHTEAECELKIAILQEQLKQEKLKTERMKVMV